MNKGRIVQVMGPVVDVVFEDGNLPRIKDALQVENNGKTCIMEVAQHLGNDEVRCLMLAASEGLCKDMEVTATGSGIKVPVGEQTLGRLFNVLGETIDNGEEIKYITDENGQLNINDIEWGNYYIQEIEVPEGYQRLTAKFTFTVNRQTFENNNTAITTVTNSETNEQVSIIKNGRLKGSVKLTKAI